MAFGSTGKMSGLLVKLFMDTKDFDKKSKGAQRKMRDMKKAVGIAGAAMAAAAIPLAGLAAGFAAIVKVGSEFEQQMARVGAMMGKGGTADAMEMLSKAALKVAANTEYSATQIAGAMEELAKAGFTAKQTAESINSVAAIATIGGTSLSSAAGLVASTLKQFSLSASESGDVADQIAVALTTSKLSFESLSAAMVYAGPAAASFGMELQQTLESVAAFADLGVEGSIGGTAMRMALQAMLSPTSEAEAILARMNTTSSEFLKIVDEKGFLEALKSIGDVSAGEAVALFGKRSASVVMGVKVMQSELDKMLTETEKQMLEREGAAVAAQKKIMSTFDGQMKQIASATESAVIAVFNGFGSELTGIMAVIKAVISEVAGTLQENANLMRNNFHMAFSTFSSGGMEAADIGRTLGNIITGIAVAVSAMVGGFGLLYSHAFVPLLWGAMKLKDIVVGLLKFFELLFKEVFGFSTAGSRAFDNMSKDTEEYKKGLQAVIDKFKSFISFITEAKDEVVGLGEAFVDMARKWEDTPFVGGLARAVTGTADFMSGGGDATEGDSKESIEDKKVKAQQTADKIRKETENAARDQQQNYEDQISALEYQKELLQYEEDTIENRVKAANIEQKILEMKLQSQVVEAQLNGDTRKVALLLKEIDRSRVLTSKKIAQIRKKVEDHSNEALLERIKKESEFRRNQLAAQRSAMKQAEDLKTKNDDERRRIDIERIESDAVRKAKLASDAQRKELRSREAAMKAANEKVTMQMRQGLISPEQYASLMEPFQQSVDLAKEQMIILQQAVAAAVQAESIPDTPEPKEGNPIKNLVGSIGKGLGDLVANLGGMLSGALAAAFGPMQLLMNSGITGLLDFAGMQQEAQEIAKERGVSLEEAGKMAVENRVKGITEFIEAFISAMPVIIGQVLIQLPRMIRMLIAGIIQMLPKLAIEIAKAMVQSFVDLVRKIAEILNPFGGDKEARRKYREKVKNDKELQKRIMGGKDQFANMGNEKMDQADYLKEYGEKSSFYSGISYVPRTMKGVTLHKGERVVPAHENEMTAPSSNYSSSDKPAQTMNAYMVVDGMVVDNAISRADKDGKGSSTKKMMSRMSNRRAGISTSKRRR